MADGLRARVAALLKAIGWTIAFGLIGLLPLVLFSIVAAAWAVKGHPGATANPNSWTMVLTQSALLLAGFLPATWLVGIRRLGLTLGDLRWRVGPIGAKGFVWGLGLGGAAAAAAMALAVVVGGAAWVRDQGSVVDYLWRAVLTTAVLAPAAFSEEIMFRGVPLVLFSRILGRGTAIVLLAIVFGCFHFLNPNVSTLGIGNIVLAGVFLGVMFYAPGGIWSAFGAHLGWNSTMAVLDAPVSGLPFSIPWINYNPGGPAWLTGGVFGPEGGILGTLAITLAVVIAVRWTKETVA